MKTVPKDIIKKIDSLFHDSDVNHEIKNLINSLWSADLNVGADQLARSILVLSDGNVQKIEDIFLHDFYGDPRDVIINAEKKIGNPGHFFTDSFDEIET